MQYPIAIEWGDEHTATGIVFPDIPGAITAGDTDEQAYEMAVGRAGRGGGGYSPAREYH